MKFAFLSLCILITQSVYGQASECLEKLRPLLQTDSERYLINSKPEVFDIFALTCEDGELGNDLYTGGAFIFIHEAAHFEDLGWEGSMFQEKENQKEPSEEEKERLKKEALERFNFYSVNNEHLGNFQSYQGLPGTSELINPYLEKNKPEFLTEDSIYMSMHDGYGGDPDSFAAQVIQGMATELNGYTHGARIQARMLPLMPNPVVTTDDQGNEYSYENPLAKLPSQLDGVMHFLYNFNLYLRLIKEERPEVYNKFYALNKDYLRSILTPSVEVLKELDHCSIRNTYENVDFYIKELIKDDTSILNEVLGEALFAGLTCKDELLNEGFETIIKGPEAEFQVIECR